MAARQFECSSPSLEVHQLEVVGMLRPGRSAPSQLGVVTRASSTLYRMLSDMLSECVSRRDGALTGVCKTRSYRYHTVFIPAIDISHLACACTPQRVAVRGFRATLAAPDTVKTH